MNEKYTIKIENFEGPFDLLFHLIEKNKIDVYDIPIALITEQYIDYINQMKELDLDITSEFLVMAATLLHIKSRMLLPKQKNIEEEELEDPREELVARLLEYKKFKQIAQDLKEREEHHGKAYYKLPDIIKIDNSNTQLIGLSSDDLINAFKRIVERNIEEDEHNNNVFSKIMNREKVSVGKKVRSIVRLLRNNENVNFERLFDSGTKMDKIATFLAVLELIKLKRIFIKQNENFGEIVVYKNKNYKRDKKNKN